MGPGALDRGFHWKAYFDRAAEALVVLDRDGHLLLANQAALSLTGYPQDATRWPPLGHLFSDEEHHRAPLRYDLLDQGKVVRNSRTLRCADGRTLPVETITSQVAPDQYLAAVRDMSEIRRTQEALRASEEKFAKAFRTSPDSITLTRLDDGRFLEVNEGFTHMTGWTAADLVGRSTGPDDLHIWDNADQQREALDAVARQGWIQGLEARFRRKGGGTVLGLVSARKMTVNGEDCVLAVIRDVTDIRRAEENLQRVQKLEALGVLAGGIAHDFNNLLTGIFGFIQVAELNLPEAHPARQDLHNALAVFDRAKALSHQLLTFARGGAPVKRVVALPLFIAQTVNFALTGSGMGARFTIAPDLWSCRVDPNQIGQVLENLVINARQAMEQGTLAVTASNHTAIGDSLLSPGPYVKVTVEDTGMGIAPEHLARVFDPFFTTKPQGTGLGLTTSYSIVRRHGGALTVESEVGRGSRFDVYLPADTSVPVVGPQDLPSKPIVGLSLLCVEDEDYIREVVQTLLTSMGHRPQTVATGTEAVDRYGAALAQGTPFDLVLIDLTLKDGERGPDVLRRLKALDPGIRAVAVSGYTEDPVMADPTVYGFVASLAKPFLEQTVVDLWSQLAAQLPTRVERW